VDGAWARGFKRADKSLSGLLEWTTVEPKAFLAYLEDVEGRIPTGGNRLEEIHTLKIHGIFREGSRTALTYQCSQQPADLRDVLSRFKSPPARTGALSAGLSRHKSDLSMCISSSFTQVSVPRVSSSSVMPRSQTSPSLASSIGRARRPPTYTDIPNTRQASLFWFYQAWSLMMVLSEIAEWRPLDRAFQGEEELLKRKMERKQLVTNPDWKGASTAEIFKYGFGFFLEKDHYTLERYSRWDVKRFYDTLCEILAPSSAQ
jgi:hypothetical protein